MEAFELYLFLLQSNFHIISDLKTMASFASTEAAWTKKDIVKNLLSVIKKYPVVLVQSSKKLGSWDLGSRTLFLKS